jgi:SAM-dependent methyltransferase
MSFEADYFTLVYGQDYERRTPRYKWQAFLRELLKFRTGGRLLEVGCGFGSFLREARAYFTCVGCDISEYALNQARQRLSAEVGLFCGAVGQLALPAPSFDVIVAFDVIEHIESLPQVFADMDRLLYHNGLFIFTIPVYDGPLGWLVRYLDQDPTHIHRCGRDFWLRHLPPPFTLTYYTGVWRYFFFKRFYLNQVSRLSRRWTPAILVVAEKVDRGWNLEARS